MDFSEWEPLYREILVYFAFDRQADEDARDRLLALATQDDIGVLRDLIEGREVTVCGNAPSLRQETGNLKGITCAADGAALVLLSAGIRPDIIVTDLDGADEPFIRMNREGTVLVVHAHGDNLPLLESWVPRLEGPRVFTTQAAPVPGVYNFGGFSDGDRAVYAMVHLGASRVSLAGFDCDDDTVPPLKRGKLFWAKKLLTRLGYEC